MIAHRSFVVVRWAHLHESLDNYFNNIATGSQMAYQYQRDSGSALGGEPVSKSTA